jgi:aspartate racemase
MATKEKVVGVLGGMGPEATLDFFAKLLAKTGAKSDQDHLHLLIDNNPKVPNRHLAIAGEGPSPGPVLAAMAARLEQAGADFLVMSCNTAHAFQVDIEAAVHIPFVSIVDETVRATLERAPGATSVGVLAAEGCLAAQLYQRAFAAHGAEVLAPQGEQLDTLMALIYRIKAGDRGADVHDAVFELAMELCSGGAEVIVAGCTEVPLVLQDEALPCPLVSSTDALVEATLAYAKLRRPLPASRAAS